MSYGRRRSDWIVQALIWVQVSALAALWGVNLFHPARLGSTVALAEAAANGMRLEAEAAKKERKAFARATMAFLKGLKMIEQERPENPGNDL